MYTVYPGLQIRVQHWGDDWHILVIFLILGGDDLKIPFWILLCPNSCFFYSFSPDFFDDLFFARQQAFFTHFLQKCLNDRR